MQQGVLALIGRLLPQAAGQFIVESIPADDGRDVFEIESVDGKIVLRGSTGVAAASGLNWYLKHYCHCHVSWCGDQLTLPAELPQVTTKVRIRTPYQYRYYFNYCTFSYSMAWWDWARWEREIDWMALNGINLPLAVTGQEAVWQNVYRGMGLSDQELGEFFAGPAFLAWGWMGNLDAWGGPSPQGWIDGQRQLQDKILARQRELGIIPVLGAFTGHVPPALAKKFPNAQIKQMHQWAGNFTGTYILDPGDPLFGQIGKAFIEEQTRLYGTDHYYSCDTFNENCPLSNDPAYLEGTTRNIYNAMAAADPQAKWVMQGWMFFFNPDDPGFWQKPQIKGLLDGADNDKLIMLDLHSDVAPLWKDKTEAYFGKPWIWTLLHSFGGNRAMFGNLEVLTQDLPDALKDPQRGDLVGMGIAPEGIEQNPIVYDLATEMIWRESAPDIADWINDYAHRRYGKDLPKARAAWKFLHQTVYNRSKNETSVPATIINFPPNFASDRGVTYYSNANLAKAWELLAACAGEVGDCDAYRYDLVDVSRQVLSNLAAQMIVPASKAFAAKDRAALKAAGQRFFQLLLDMDELLGTRAEFLLGKWLGDARKWATSEDEKAFYEWNARTQVTLWGNRESMLRDYARKEWAGMIRGYYLLRWQQLFKELDTCLEQGREFDNKAFQNELRGWEEKWTHQNEFYFALPKGDAVKVARKMLRKYKPVIKEFYAFEPNLAVGKPVITSSGTQAGHPAAAALDGVVDRSYCWWASPAPQWLMVDLKKPTRIDSVQVYPYWDPVRYYRYSVESSIDGLEWTQLVDASKNETPATPDGFAHSFAPREARYVRLNMLHNSANEAIHLVEFKIFNTADRAK